MNKVHFLFYNDNSFEVKFGPLVSVQKEIKHRISKIIDDKEMEFIQEIDLYELQHLVINNIIYKVKCELEMLQELKSTIK